MTPEQAHRLMLQTFEKLVTSPGLLLTKAEATANADAVSLLTHKTYAVVEVTVHGRTWYRVVEETAEERYKKRHYQGSFEIQNSHKGGTI